MTFLTLLESLRPDGRWGAVFRASALAGVLGLFGMSAEAQQTAQPQTGAHGTTGVVAGTVTDPVGALVPNAQVTLTPEGSDAVPAMPLVLKTDGVGAFKFADVPAGSFLLAVTAEGFQATTVDGKLIPGQQEELPAIVLQIGAATTDVLVTPQTDVQIAEEEVKEEEHQKVFGIIPNFFVVYKTHPVPLNARQKMRLAFRGTIDPFPFAASAFVAGIEQAADTLPGYHQGAEGYAKRYGAAYVNFASATMLRDGLFPAIFRQDPRYYYQGTGTKKSRVLYAMSTAVICHGDDGKKQFDISSVLGNFSAGALTQLYYPKGSRNGTSTTLENGLLATAGVGVGHVLQEFLFDRITNKKGSVGK
jgi:hypothetical protein